jgi:hypothetical protein
MFLLRESEYLLRYSRVRLWANRLRSGLVPVPVSLFLGSRVASVWRGGRRRKFGTCVDVPPSRESKYLLRYSPGTVLGRPIKICLGAGPRFSLSGLPCCPGLGGARGEGLEPVPMFLLRESEYLLRYSRVRLWANRLRSGLVPVPVSLFGGWRRCSVSGLERGAVENARTQRVSPRFLSFWLR